MRSGCGGCGGRRTVRTRGPEERPERPETAPRPRRTRAPEVTPDAGTAATADATSGRRGQRYGAEEAALLLEGTAAPHRYRAGARAADQDLPGAGVLDPLGLDAEHPAAGRPGAGRQADPVVRLGARARRGRRLPRPGRLAGGRADPEPERGAEGPQLDRPDAVRRGEGPDQAGRSRSAATRSSARRAARSRSTARRSTSRTSTPATPPCDDEPVRPVQGARGQDLGHGRPPAELPGLPLPPAGREQGLRPGRQGRRPRRRGRLAAHPLVHAAGAGHLRPARAQRRGCRGRARARGRGAAGAVAQAPAHRRNARVSGRTAG